MLRTLLPIAFMLAACTPSPEKAAMPTPSPAAEFNTRGASTSGPAASDSPEEALGRRTLSTAFVMVGPDGHLTVELRDGRSLVLRDVVMHAKDYCGVSVAGDRARAKHCGGYAEVVAARPGGGPRLGQAE